MASTEIAEKETAEAVIGAEDLEAQLAAQNQADRDDDDFRIPILKVAQALTKEVEDGTARSGDYVLSLTGQSFGQEIEMVIANKNTGRFLPGNRNPNGGRTLAADGNIVPWADDPFHGQPFSEHPDAEEQYSARVNGSDGKIPWGKGPAIQTTMNYTGFIIDPDDGLLEIPLRLSVRLTNKHIKSFRSKFNMLLDAVLRGRYWEKTFILGVEKQSNANGDSYYVPTVKQGRKTTPEEKAAALGLAQIVQTQAVTTVGEGGAEPTPEPEDTGGIGL